MDERPVSGTTIFAVANMPSTSDDHNLPPIPRAPYMTPTSDSLRESYNATPNDSGTLLANKPEINADDRTIPSLHSKRRSVILILLILLAVALIVVAVIVPVYFTVIKPKVNATKSNTPAGPGPKSGGPNSGPTPSPGSPNATTGGDGSTIHAADGSTFIYHNSFGGFCKCFTDFIFCLTETVEASVWSVLLTTSSRG